MCSNGYAQVTYARKAAGQAAIENLHGKKADNGKENYSDLMVESSRVTTDLE